MTQKLVRRKGAEHLTFVESENDNGTEYEISKLPDGSKACACMSFVFNKEVPKTCKHINAYKMASVGFDRQNTQRSEPRSKVSVGGESFTFTRRAISFGKV